LVLALGVLCLVFGAISIGIAWFNLDTPGDPSERLIDFANTGYVLVGIGTLGLFTGVYRLIRLIEKLLRKGESRGLTEIAFDAAQRESAPKLVAIGGGTGLSTMLRGLKNRPLEIAAIVSMADDGGSSGRLRKDFDTLPPGDVRNCLVALAGAGVAMKDLMQYRFDSGEFSGHSFGNLFIMVLSQVRGDFGSAILEANRILAVRGKVLPATLDRISLVATHPDGSKTTGQRFIAQCGKKIERLECKPSSGRAPEDVIQEIEAADIVLFGPGSLYTSVLPPLLEPDIVGAIQSSSAVKVFVINTMSQPGETDGFHVSDYLESFQKHAPGVELDAVLINSFRPSNKALEEHQARGVELTEYNRKELASGHKVRIFLRDLIDLADPSRHDPEKTADAVMEIVEQLVVR
jgi:uncharacterized cofD-like protein